MPIDQYLRSLRLTDQVSWRAMWLGITRYKPDPDKADFYSARRLERLGQLMAAL